MITLHFTKETAEICARPGPGFSDMVRHLASDWLTLHVEVERLTAALHDAEAIGDFSEELRDRLRLKEAAACVPTLMAEVEQLTATLASLRQAKLGKLREAFMDGAFTWVYGGATRDQLAAEALRRYPDPPEVK